MNETEITTAITVDEARAALEKIKKEHGTLYNWAKATYHTGCESCLLYLDEEHRSKTCNFIYRALNLDPTAESFLFCTLVTTLVDMLEKEGSGK